MNGLSEKAACPYFYAHGNPFRYCACGWIEDVAAESSPGTTDIGELLRRTRERSGLSYREAAELLETSASNLHKIEHGSDPRWSLAQRILAWSRQCH